jgi:hypothetical protein
MAALPSESRCRRMPDVYVRLVSRIAFSFEPLRPAPQLAVSLCHCQYPVKSKDLLRFIASAGGYVANYLVALFDQIDSSLLKCSAVISRTNWLLIVGSSVAIEDDRLRTIFSKVASA